LGPIKIKPSLLLQRAQDRKIIAANLDAVSSGVFVLACVNLRPDLHGDNPFHIIALWVPVDKSCHFCPCRLESQVIDTAVIVA
jgi:hypothetical protein